MFASVALFVSSIALSMVPQPIAQQPIAQQPIPELHTTGAQADAAADGSENLVAELDTTGEVETPREWKKRMVRSCTRSVIA